MSLEKLPYSLEGTGTVAPIYRVPVHIGVLDHQVSPHRAIGMVNLQLSNHVISVVGGVERDETGRRGQQFPDLRHHRGIGRTAFDQAHPRMIEPFSPVGQDEINPHYNRFVGGFH